MSEEAPLDLLREIHALQLRGIVEDLRAPFDWVATGEEDLDKAALEEAWVRHRSARRWAEACLNRNGISAQLDREHQDTLRLQAAVASKLGQFRSLRTLDERRARAIEMVLPPAQAVTPASDDADPAR